MLLHGELEMDKKIAFKKSVVALLHGANDYVGFLVAKEFYITTFPLSVQIIVPKKAGLWIKRPFTITFKDVKEFFTVKSNVT
jgi:hypothetical protein